MKKINYDVSQMCISEKDFFCDMLSYISETIDSIKRGENEVQIIYDGIEEDELLRKIQTLKEMACSQNTGSEGPLKLKLLKDNRDRDTCNKDNIFAEMLDNRMIMKISEGSFLYSGLYLKIYQYFNRKVDAFARDTFGNLRLREMEVPCLTPIRMYEEGGYFESFPHYIMFNTTMKNDLDIIDRFSKNGLKDETILFEMKIPTELLRTATCAPVYPYLREQLIDSSSADCYLVSGKCFRNEGKNVEELARLKEFYMKEYVYIGNPEQVNSEMERAFEIWDYWTEIFSLNCMVETANDSFFASNYKKLKLFQLLGASKLEFKWLIPGNGKYISCSSANYHRTHFTKTYNIRSKDTNSYCHTNCFAFGIERLAYALISQKGLDIDKWDQKTITEISKYVTL